MCNDINEKIIYLSLLIQDLICFCIAIDLKTAQGALHKGPYSGKADVTFTVADEDFMDVVLGKLNPQKVPYCMNLPHFIWKIEIDAPDVWMFGVIYHVNAVVSDQCFVCFPP